MAFISRDVRRLAGVILAVLTLGAAALAQGGPPPPGVTVAPPLARKIISWDEYTGRFEAVEQVEIRARVSGFLDAVHFRDGQVVKKGEALFTIDPRPYLLSAEAARAEVARAQALVQLAEREVVRAESLTENRSITIRDADQRKATLAGAKAAQAVAEASQKTAELNLEWTVVYAPISGRISNKRVDVGNLVAGGQGGATLLTTIVSTDPIHFAFDASEADFLRYSRQFSAVGQNASREMVNPVQVRLADETTWTRNGRMNFVDNQLNARSGTIRSRAVFDNKDQFLTPGAFGRLRLSGGEVEALLVPDAAIVSDQARKIVLVVGADNKVIPKPVILGPIAEGLRVIQSGLAPGDRIIITGLANPMVRPGAMVTPQPGEIRIPPAN